MRERRSPAFSATQTRSISPPPRLPVIRATLGLVAALAAVAGCGAGLRIRGSEAAEARPTLAEVSRPAHEYRVSVLVPEVRVRTFPQQRRLQQPMLQFTGDRERLDRGWGQMAVLVAPEEFHDGELVTYFEDRVLWTELLTADDPRTFSLWLRANNRSGPTRLDQQLAPVLRLAGALEELSGAGGFKIPAQRAINITREAFRELQRDWLILSWTCPWRHVLAGARPRLEASGRREVVMEARLAAREQAAGRPAAELTVRFVVQRTEHPGALRETAPR
ncbi:MAG TPA: hypothetical protein VGQ83_41970 [Polyangia bacterium]